MQHKLIFTEVQWKQLSQHLLQGDRNERMAFGFGSINHAADVSWYLVKMIDLPDDKEYRDQSLAGVTLKAEFVLPRLLQAQQFSVLIDCHSHPFTEHPYPSQTDDLGARQQLHVLRDLAPNTVLVRLIIGKTGKVWAEVWHGEEWKTISEIRILGQQQQIMIQPVNRLVESVRQFTPYDIRTRAVLGDVACKVVRHLHVLIIGVGGTGSSVATFLRGYVNEITLIDSDTFETHNGPRSWAYVTGDEGIPKVAAHKREIQRAFPQVEVHVMQEKFPSPTTLEAFKQADIIFCCPDNNATRYAAAQAASQFCKPLIEIGCGGKQTNGQITALGYHVRLQVPGLACLACNGMDLKTLEDPSTTVMKERVGYIEDGEFVQGELMSLTSRAAADAVDLFFRYVTGYAKGSYHLYFDALNFNSIDLTQRYQSHPDCPICGCRGDSLFAMGEDLFEHQKILPGSPTEIV